MKCKYKNIFLMIVVFLAITALTISCRREVENEISQTESVTGKSVPEIDPYDDELPEFDFAGKEMYVRSIIYEQNSYLTLFDIDEQTGDVVVDAIYQRNRSIEERFNMKFISEEDTYDNNYSILKSAVLANDSIYDLVQIINRNAFQAGLESYLMPMNLLTYINLDKPYYSQDINNQMTINGTLLFAYSDECFQMFESAIALIFNKDITTNLNLEYPYELVKEGQWTLDNFKKYLTDGSADLDGDGSFTTASDRYGLISNSDFLIPTFWISSGEYSISKDDNDLPFFNAPGNERFITSLMKCADWSAEDGIIWDHPGDRVETIHKFINGRAYFCCTTVGRLGNLREMDGDYGILPFPKFDEEQEQYYSRVIDGWLHVVPISASDPEFISVIMEALANETANSVFPAYYDKALTQKILRDNESVEMLEIIRQNRVMDIGDVPLMSTVRNPYVSEISSGRNSIESVSASIKSSVESKLNEIVETLKK